MRRAYARDHLPRPELSEQSLSSREKAYLRNLRSLKPEASEATLLSWVEGYLYRPTQDPDFMEQCGLALQRWQQTRGTDQKTKEGKKP